MKRRHFLYVLTGGVAGAAAWRYWPDQGWLNPCGPLPLPAELARHEIVQAVWEDLDPNQVWDCHVHLAGLGDSNSGIWVNPELSQWWHPLGLIQRAFYLNATCADSAGQVDQSYLQRLRDLHRDFRPGAKLMLLAFDFRYQESGRQDRQHSTFYVPNKYVRSVAARYPEQFEWIASVHPYRPDALEALQRVANGGARAIKWIPQSQGMDPASSRCDRFYDKLVELGLPLLTHAGTEHAVADVPDQSLGNPLKLRRALDRGVRVIVAHCASLGSGVDLDKGPNGPERSNFDLFARLMDETQYTDRLYGDISAMTQINRLGVAFNTVILRDDWHPRLLNGSDYPLPAVMPLFSVGAMVDRGYFPRSEAEFITRLHRRHPLLFDLVVKRRAQHQGKRLSPLVFQSRRVFQVSGT